jgi:hypothetical protein
LLKPRKNCPPCGIDKSCKGAVELTGSIVHHLVKYSERMRRMSSPTLVEIDPKRQLARHSRRLTALPRECTKTGVWWRQDDEYDKS